MPQTRTAASPGHDLELVVYIRNSAEDLAVASGVATYIFDPDGDVSDFSTALAMLTPVSPSTGVYVSTYTVPYNPTAGVWHDRWTGWLDGEALSYVFDFNVVDSGIITETSLRSNNVVTITIDKDVRSSEGGSLEEDYEFYFTTEYTPTYTHYNQIMLDIGRYVRNIPKDTIWRAILSASLEANDRSLVSPDTVALSDYFLFARRMWTRCRAEEVLLLEAMQDFDIKRKRVGDHDVTWHENQAKIALEKALACMEDWLPAMESGGVKIKRAAHFVKGDNDLDRPAFGRDWISPDADISGRIMPAGNVKYKGPYLRRYSKTYLSRRLKG